MTSTRPLPDHGTYARANGSPGYRPRCKCELCVEERRRRDKRNRVNRELGKGSLIDPAEARAHLALLHKTMAWESLAAATGIPISNLCYIYTGRRTKIFRDTHEKIMAVRPHPSGDPGQTIDSTGSVRRVRALCAIGHSYQAIADATGSARTRIAVVAAGTCPTIRRGYANRIARAYEQLASAPAPRNKHTVRVRNHAAAQGWPDPTWWEDYGHIDDPAFDPATAETGNRSKGAAAEEARHLLAFGVAVPEVADRVGCTEHYVKQIRAELHGRRWRRQQYEEAA